MWDSALDDLIANADQHGVDPAYLKAWRELGYVLTEENKHLFSAAEVQAFFDAVEKYHDDESEDDPDVDDIIDLLAPQLEAVVEVTLKQQSPQPARLFVAALIEGDIATADLENYDVEKDGSLSFRLRSLSSSPGRSARGKN